MLTFVVGDHFIFRVFALQSKKDQEHLKDMTTQRAVQDAEKA